MTDSNIVARLRESDGGYFMRKMFSEAADEIERLRKERDEAYSKSAEVIADLSAKLCTASAVEREKLIAERDEARRMYCVLRDGDDGMSCSDWAERKGWSCFEENSETDRGNYE